MHMPLYRFAPALEYVARDAARFEQVVDIFQ